jgi:hypothetical protein
MATTTNGRSLTFPGGLGDSAATIDVSQCCLESGDVISGRELLGAVIDVVLTGIWILGGVSNNVCYEALSMPENILMI